MLIFKVAVALGFDAPLFALVSMRGAKDTDFGIQVVGRILRVHHRLQAKALDNIASGPAALRIRLPLRRREPDWPHRCR